MFINVEALDQQKQKNDYSRTTEKIEFSKQSLRVASEFVEKSCVPELRKLPQNKFLTEIVINNSAVKTENDIPVFRGSASHPLEITPYAIRVNRNGRIEIENDLKVFSDNLAKEPNLSNFLQYTEYLKNYTTNESQLRDIEYDSNYILRHLLIGQSVRDSLIYLTIQRNGGSLDTHVTPYTSATLDSSVATGYANGNYITILGLTSQEIEAGNANSHELMIKSGVNQERIRGVIDVSKINQEISENSNQDMTTILTELGFDPSKVDTSIEQLNQQLDKRKKQDKLDVLQDKNLAEVTIVNNLLSNYSNFAGNNKFGITIIECLKEKKLKPNLSLEYIALSKLFNNL